MTVHGRVICYLSRFEAVPRAHLRFTRGHYIWQEVGRAPDLLCIVADDGVLYRGCPYLANFPRGAADQA